MRKLPDYDILDSPESEPIVFYGQPDGLQGELSLRNPGEQNVVLRSARLHSEALMQIAATAKDKQAPLAIEQAIRTVVLRPGQGQRMPVNIALNVHTPPGEYRGEIEVAGRTRPAIFYVTEMLALEVSPPRFVLENRPGERISKQVVISNVGNVPITIGEFGAITLDDELLQCITGRAAVAHADELETLDQYYVELLRQNKRVLESQGFLRVHNATGIVTIQPGEVRQIDLEIRIPEKLGKRSRYFGSVPIYTANLDFIVVPSAHGVTESEPEEPPKVEPQKPEPKPTTPRRSPKTKSG
jgi:hypothetical protein